MKTINDYAHCVACDIVINLDTEEWHVVNDSTYCEACYEN